MSLFARIVAVAAGLLATTLSVAPAQAARPPMIDLRGAGLGSHVIDDGGAAVLSGSVTGAPFAGAYTATLAATDGSLPAPGSCEPAAATVQVVGSRSRHLQLTGSGRVCGEWSDTTNVVTHRFVGRYEVTAASARRLRDTDGWYSLIMATEGRANVETLDT